LRFIFNAGIGWTKITYARVATRRVVSSLGTLHGGKMKADYRAEFRSSTRGIDHSATEDVVTSALPVMARAVRAPAFRAFAIGALTCGAFALGALAIGRLAVGFLAIGKSRIRRLEIEELEVKRLRVIDLEVVGAPVTPTNRTAGTP
jgi:hypothetical protein